MSGPHDPVVIPASESDAASPAFDVSEFRRVVAGGLRQRSGAGAANATQPEHAAVRAKDVAVKGAGVRHSKEAAAVAVGPSLDPERVVQDFKRLSLLSESSVVLSGADTPQARLKAQQLQQDYRRQLDALAEKLREEGPDRVAALARGIGALERREGDSSIGRLQTLLSNLWPSAADPAASFFASFQAVDALAGAVKVLQEQVHGPVPTGVTIAPSVPQASVADSELPFPEISQEHSRSTPAEGDSAQLSVPAKVLAQERFHRAHRIVHQHGVEVVQATMNGLEAPQRAKLLGVLRSGVADPERARAEQPALKGFSDHIWSVLPDLLPELGTRHGANAGQHQPRVLQMGPVAPLSADIETTLHGVAAALNTAQLARTIHELRTLAESGFTHRDPVPEMLQHAQRVQEGVEAAAVQLLSNDAQLPTNSQFSNLAIKNGQWRYDSAVDGWVNDTAATMPNFASWIAELAKPASASVAAASRFPRHGLRDPDAVTLQAIAHETQVVEEFIPKFIQEWLPLQRASLIQQESEAHKSDVQKLLQQQAREIAAQQSHLERLTVEVAEAARSSIPHELLGKVKVLLQRECLAHDTEFRAWKSRGVGSEPPPHFMYRALWGEDPSNQSTTTKPLEGEAEARTALELLESKMAPLHRIGQRITDLDRLGRQTVHAQLAGDIYRDIQRVSAVAAHELAEELSRTQIDVVETMRYSLRGVEAQPPQVRRALGKFLQGALQREEWSLRGSISAGLPGLAESAFVDELHRVQAVLVAKPACAPLVSAHLVDLFNVVSATMVGNSDALGTARREVAQVLDGKEVTPELLRSLEDLSRVTEVRLGDILRPLQYGAVTALHVEAERLDAAGVPGAQRLSGALNAARIARVKRINAPLAVAEAPLRPLGSAESNADALAESPYAASRSRGETKPILGDAKPEAIARAASKKPSPSRLEVYNDPEEIFGAFCVMVDLREAALDLKSHWEDYHSGRERAKHLLGVFHETLNKHLPLQPSDSQDNLDTNGRSPNIVRDVISAAVARINEMYGVPEEDGSGVEIQPELHVEALSEVLEKQLGRWQQRAAQYEPEQISMAAAVAAQRLVTTKETDDGPYLEKFIKFLNRRE